MSLMLALYLFLISDKTDVGGCPDVEMVGRSEWGARTSLENDTMQMPVGRIFIHHTVTGQCQDFGTCAKIVRGIQKYHMVDRGWDDVGYNFLLGGDGRVYVGRGWDRVGAHTYGFNRISVAFALLGDFSNEPPSDLMLQTAKKLVECASNEGHVTAEYKLHGHRDGSCTECPGDALYAVIQGWPRFVAGPLPGYSCARAPKNN